MQKYMTIGWSFGWKQRDHLLSPDSQLQIKYSATLWEYHFLNTTEEEPLEITSVKGDTNLTYIHYITQE